MSKSCLEKLAVPPCPVLLWFDLSLCASLTLLVKNWTCSWNQYYVRVRLWLVPSELFKVRFWKWYEIKTTTLLWFYVYLYLYRYFAWNSGVSVFSGNPAANPVTIGYSYRYFARNLSFYSLKTRWQPCKRESRGSLYSSDIGKVVFSASCLPSSNILESVLEALKKAADTVLRLRGRLLVEMQVFAL